MSVERHAMNAAIEYASKLEGENKRLREKIEQIRDERDRLKFKLNRVRDVAMANQDRPACEDMASFASCPSRPVEARLPDDRPHGWDSMEAKSSRPFDETAKVRE